MTPQAWATEIVKVLQDDGYDALWAGGCVRDAILGKKPKDYDVATSATPDQVQEVFGIKKTLAIGKSFGVITVIGPRSAGHIEVATFRRDGGYSDGRRPDSVEFTNAKEDAMRRDFTINGMFFDPIKSQVIDYVGGKKDIERKVVRAIGNAQQRIDEDKLRMLRGVRFAATYGFELEHSTLSAIQTRAKEIDAVSPERIGTELRKMLGHSSNSHALRLLVKTNLWSEVVPFEESEIDWDSKIGLLSNLNTPDFPTAVAALLSGTQHRAAGLQDAWRLKNEEVARADWILEHESELAEAKKLNWSALQPMLVSPHATSSIELLEALSKSGLAASKGLDDSIARCRKKLQLPPELLNPKQLIDGQTLKNLGISPGPQFKSILNAVREKQLDEALRNRDEAIDWVQQRFLLNRDE